MRQISLIIVLALAIDALPVPPSDDVLSHLGDTIVNTVNGLLGLAASSEDGRTPNVPVCEFRQYFCVGRCIGLCLEGLDECYDCLTPCQKEYLCTDGDEEVCDQDGDDDDDDDNNDDDNDDGDTNSDPDAPPKDSHIKTAKAPKRRTF